MKEYLDKLVETFETPDFIKKDPIQFPRGFKNKEDIEISAFVSSTLAYGKREKIIEALGKLHNIMQNSPYEFVKSFEYNKDKHLFDNFSYRYTEGKDIALMFFVLNRAIKEHGSLENLFKKGFERDIKEGLENFTLHLKEYALELDNSVNRGFNHLIPSPKQGSACKRLNLFLKWLVRDGCVDIGIWKSIPKSALMIPLDTHVARVSRKLGFTKRKSDDWKTAAEITEKLREYCPDDPTKYDFAIFGGGIAHLM